jgi:hypothetical protein
VGPSIFLFIKIFKHSHFDIRIGDLVDLQISFLAQLQISKGLQVINFGINLNLNLNLLEF